MSFDTKRLRTFKWLQSIADKGRGNRTSNIIVYCGHLYATDNYMLAQIDYPEFEHLSDWEWSKVTRYFDDEGKLLLMPEIEPLERQFENNDFFDSLFIRECARFDLRINPKFLKNALKPFEINGVLPNVYTDETCIMLAGHNRDISIRVVLMGVK